MAFLATFSLFFTFPGLVADLCLFAVLKETLRLWKSNNCLNRSWLPLVYTLEALTVIGLLTFMVLVPGLGPVVNRLAGLLGVAIVVSLLAAAFLLRGCRSSWLRPVSGR